MESIVYNNEKYSVLLESRYDNLKIRKIKFDTGYYALQYYNGYSWKTICISPYLDKKGDLYFIRGDLEIDYLMECVKDTYNFRKGEYYELKVNVSDTDYEELTQKISEEEGWTLYESIIQLNRTNEQILSKKQEITHDLVFICFSIFWILIVLTLYFKSINL